MTKEKHYFASGNTADGYTDFYKTSLENLDRVFILKGGPGTGKSTLMKKIGGKLQQQGQQVEWVHCTSDPTKIDFVIFPELKTGIVDGTAPHIVEPEAPGAIEEYVNLGVAWDPKHLTKHRDEILALKAIIKESHKRAYQLFKEARETHDQWEHYYISNLDIDKADQLANQINKRFIPKEQQERPEVGISLHRFLGAATPYGTIDFVPQLTENVAKRIFLKGRPGTGKSTLLKKIAKEAEVNGYEVEVYHCGFDPQSLDMVIIRELGFAIFDSTAPHEYVPERSGDEILDLYEVLVTNGTDERYASDLARISTVYKAQMREALASLKDTKNAKKKLEEIYGEAMNFLKVDAICNRIEKELELFANPKD
jgi:nucleoside-triphosphatase THEP1